MGAVAERTATREIPDVGTLEFEETETRRAYWLRREGAQRRTRLPSVTTILGTTWPKPGLLEWYRKHGDQAVVMRDAAAERGKLVHSFVEHYMVHGEIPPLDGYPIDTIPYVSGVARFIWEFQPEPREVELLVCHPEHGYAGRLDLIADVAGARTLLDFKTNPAGNVWPEAHVQASAYMLADDRCGGDAIEAALLVGLAEDGTYNPVVGRDAGKVWATTLDFYRDMGKFRRDLNGGGR